MTGLPPTRRPRVMCVDDEPNVLEGLVAFLRRRYRVTTANSGAAGLLALDEHGPFDVVVSDMRMPGMDGAAFLAEVRELAPDTTRILLTGHAEMTAAIEAVNRGGVFRFLTKPCPPADLLRAVQEGVRQHELRRAEKELLQETLKGAVATLTEVMAVSSPELFGRANRIQRTVRMVVQALALDEPWKYELAAMLSQVGLVGVDHDVVRRAYGGGVLTAEERTQFESHPITARRFLARIPRLGEVAQMVASQRSNVTVAQAARALQDRQAGVLGGHILRVALDVDVLLQQGVAPLAAIERLEGSDDVYNPRVLEVLGDLYAERSLPTRRVPVAELALGMVLLEPLRTDGGLVVVPAGHEITVPLRAGVARFARQSSLVEPVLVQLPDPDGRRALPTVQELLENPL